MGGQTNVKKIPENVVAVVFGSIKPYFYFVLRCVTGAYPLQQTTESLHVVGDSEHICKDNPSVLMIKQ